jgi:predicted nucleotidyltransferase
MAVKGDKGIGKRERNKIASDFKNAVLKMYGGDFIKCIILFGSTARKDTNTNSDIDVLVIIDDTVRKAKDFSKEDMEKELLKIASSVSRELNIQGPESVTDFWGSVRNGHPVTFNVLRDGVPLYDIDFFAPLKRLLERGEIRPSMEAVDRYMEQAPKRLGYVKNGKVVMVAEDCYSAMVMSAQAALMMVGEHPPRPLKLAEALRKSLVKRKLMKEADVKELQKIVNLRKRIIYKRVNEMSGEGVDMWLNRAEDFVEQMENTLRKIERLKLDNPL